VSEHAVRALAKPVVACAVVEIDRTDALAKLHQNFPDADRLSVAEHLSCSRRDEVRALAAKIRAATPI
jgi:hypothetical protein